jgi:hypothetical protein
VNITDIIEELNLDPARVRPVGIILLVLAFAATLWGVWMLIRTVRSHGNLTTLRMSLRMIWVWSIPLAFGFMLVALMLIGAPKSALTVESALTFTIPLAAGLHAALALSVPDEPILELHLTFRRPFVWLAAERFLVVLAIHIGIGLIGTVIGVASYGGDFIKIVVAWLPATVLLAGLGFRVSLSTRQIGFGALAVLAAWIGTRWYQEQVTIFGAFLWPVNPFLPAFSMFYLRPGMLVNADYTLNRVLVFGLGIALVVLALQELRDAEKIFTGQRTHTQGNG